MSLTQTTNKVLRLAISDHPEPVMPDTMAPEDDEDGSATALAQALDAALDAALQTAISTEGWPPAAQQMVALVRGASDISDRLLGSMSAPDADDDDQYKATALSRLVRLASADKPNPFAKKDDGGDDKMKPHGFMPGGPGGDAKCGKAGCGKGKGDAIHKTDAGDKPLPFGKK